MVKTSIADKANFARSDEHPTSMGRLIKCPTPYYYHWRRDMGMDILVFENPTYPSTARLFRYSRSQIYMGIDLTKDKPTVVGEEEVVKVLQKYSDGLAGVPRK